MNEMTTSDIPKDSNQPASSSQSTDLAVVWPLAKGLAAAGGTALKKPEFLHGAAHSRGGAFKERKERHHLLLTQGGLHPRLAHGAAQQEPYIKTPAFPSQVLVL